MRIARALALAGIDSRRKCEAHITNGAVTVNGEVIYDLGRQVDLETDAVCFRGRLINAPMKVYYILNKPRGFTTTVKDEHVEKTVFDLLPRQFVPATRQVGRKATRVFPVGRLDRDSEGLLLFTNDGELANQLMHPRYQVPRTYHVRLNRVFEQADRKKLLSGVPLEDGLCRMKDVRTLSKRILRVVLCEGKKREIRRAFEAMGYEVVRLCRMSLGPLGLGSLPSGAGRALTSKEVEALRSLFL